MNHPARWLGIATACAVAACDDGDPPSFDPCDLSGYICTWAGVPHDVGVGDEGVPATASRLYLPVDLTFAPDGTAFVADFNNHRIGRVDPDGTLHTIAGTGFLGDGPEGEAIGAAFNHPTGLAVHPTDPHRLAVGAWHNGRIEELDLETGTIRFIAGTGGRDYNGDGLPALEAALDLPSSVAWSEDGADLYFMDQANQLLRRLGADGRVHDVGGTPRTPGDAGDGGPVGEALFDAMRDSNADPSNRIAIHGHRLFLADTGNHRVRVVDLESGIILPFAGDGTAGYEGDGDNALRARFDHPVDVAVGIDGEVYVADPGNNCVRVIRPDGVVWTFAGRCGAQGWVGFRGDGGPAIGAALAHPAGVAVDPDGNVYVADTMNHLIRRIAR
jgi:trimeric autotransporter adhesin